MRFTLSSIARIALGVAALAPIIWLTTETAAQQPRNAGQEWPSYGHDLFETHFSPLKQITTANVSGLKLAFAGAIDAPQGNVQATPIVVNGTMYTSLAWGVIVA